MELRARESEGRREVPCPARNGCGGWAAPPAARQRSHLPAAPSAPSLLLPAGTGTRAALWWLRHPLGVAVAAVSGQWFLHRRPTFPKIPSQELCFEDPSRLSVWEAPGLPQTRAALVVAPATLHVDAAQRWHPRYPSRWKRWLLHPPRRSCAVSLALAARHRHCGAELGSVGRKKSEGVCFYV